MLNVATLSSVPSTGYMYLKASAIADLLSIACAVPFVIRHGNRHDPHARLSMLFHAHAEVPLFNAFATARFFLSVNFYLENTKIC